MTGAPADPLAVALAPVRAALYEHARREGAQAFAEAAAAAQAALASATVEASQILARARDAGAAAATAFAATQRSRADREARAGVLRARREEYDALRDAARAAVTALREDPDYPRLRTHLEAAARALLGPRATIRDTPDGGVEASVPGRRVDLSLAVLAERAVATVVAAHTGSAP